MLVNLYWLVETHYGQCSSTVSCRCLQIYKLSVPCISQWLRKGECYPKPRCSIKYKEAFLALNLTWEIQYYLCLYISRGHFNVGQVCYELFEKTKTPKQQQQQQKNPHQFVIKLLLVNYVLEHYSTANFLNKSTNRSQIFLEFIVIELPECLKQTKNNTPAKKAFLVWERKDGSFSHHRAFLQGSSKVHDKWAGPGATKASSPWMPFRSSSEQDPHRQKDVLLLTEMDLL